MSNCNIIIDDQNFINFDQVKGLSEYRMKFDWDGKTLEWTQKKNPLDPSIRGHDLKVCENGGCIVTNGATSLHFIGLSLSTTPNLVLLDGALATDWAYAVGHKIKINGGLNSFKENPSKAYAAKLTKLYVQLPGKNLKFLLSIGP